MANVLKVTSKMTKNSMDFRSIKNNFILDISKKVSGMVKEF